ncbi:hypothetical protein [Algoriphagus kandeliae]|uniref:hypothetical protein n=1 Tax=Algoriphagus kandeliae TaxID=2562278 RepID=UPI0013867CB9|nr:hypothetical protein [Algoriphagus kandeliae]
MVKKKIPILLFCFFGFALAPISNSNAQVEGAYLADGYFDEKNEKQGFYLMRIN